jgi:hypothetical protein
MLTNFLGRFDLFNFPQYDRLATVAPPVCNFSNLDGRSELANQEK